MNYKDYQKARDAAWETLVRFRTSGLPVHISDGIRGMGIVLAPYSKAGPALEATGLARLMGETDGISVRRDGRYYIFYRGDMTPGRIRFTVAHELGHILLGHLEGRTHTTRNREPAPGDSPIEQAANVFASRLLAPACVLHDLNALTPEDIAELCDISLTAARFRAERMGLLDEREMFCTSPLEKKVHKQFRRFIRSQRRHPAP